MTCCIMIIMIGFCINEIVQNDSCIIRVNKGLQCSVVPRPSSTGAPTSPQVVCGAEDIPS